MKKEFFIASIGTELSDISVKVIKIMKLCDYVISDLLDYKTLIQIKQINNSIKIECLHSKVSKDINKRSNYIVKRIKTLFKKYNKIMLLTTGNLFF